MLVGTSFAETLEGMWKKYSRAIAILSIVAIVATLGLSIKNQFWQLQIPAKAKTLEEKGIIYPVGPVEYLEQAGFSGNVMSPFNYASYISWKMPPVKVSIDSRYEVAYPLGALDESVAFYNASEGWEQRLQKYSTDAVLIHRGTLLSDHLDRLAELGWFERYRDQSFLLLFREPIAEGLEKVDRTDDKIRGTFP